MAFDFKIEYERYHSLFENYLQNEVAKLQGHKTLVSAMKYSLLAGGKRVRPVLMLATNECFGGEVEKALPFALAIECIHTYSLIHDDLPALDNDDLRRGKPTNHKVFGEDIAIIAGDALLNYAFELCLENAETKREIEATKFIAQCSGYRGMVGGQAADLKRELEDDEKQLIELDVGKTSKLICAALVSGAILAGGDSQAMNEFGENLGIIYQFVDDLLDVKSDEATLGKQVNKDAELGKLTAVSVYGIEQAEKQVERFALHCKSILNNVKNSAFLEAFLDYSLNRKN